MVYKNGNLKSVARCSVWRTLELSDRTEEWFVVVVVGRNIKINSLCHSEAFVQFGIVLLTTVK